MGIDQIQINFNETAIFVMNLVIAFIMFGVALDLKVQDFKDTLKNPKAAIIGLICQFLLLPGFTYLMVILIEPGPSIALGLFLVAACPGGNLSNFLTHYAKGNTPLSISMSAVSTAIAIEVGIQNSGLGLVLIFTFFNGLGGMALVAAFWGIWHIISGLTVATFWSKRAPSNVPQVVRGESRI